MADTAIGTPKQLRDPNNTPALHRNTPLGFQYVLAMIAVMLNLILSEGLVAEVTE